MIESPCIRRCCLDDNDICIGCLRTLDEICHWSQANDHDKQKILAAADERRVISAKNLPENGSP